MSRTEHNGYMIRRGHKQSEETKKKISKTMKGKMPKFVPTHKGYKHLEETKEKLRQINLGKKHTKETKEKMSKSRSKEKCHFWKGGISFEPYSLDWTKTLKRSIRERDKYTCRLCGKQQSDRAFDVHHIDYNKQNCNPINLITLCHRCHMKTNFNREYWIEYLRTIIIKF